MSVYFVTCREANAVKIGSSLEPHARLREIQWGCPLELRLEAVLPGNAPEERAMHERFAEHRMRGEWFTITEMIEAIIAANPAPPPMEKTNAGKLRLRERLSRRQREERNAANAVAEIEARHRRFMRSLEMRGDICFPFRQPALEDS